VSELVNVDDFLEVLRKFETIETPGEDGINMELLNYATQSFLNISIDFIDIV
jgi:hypothetical protein